MTTSPFVDRLNAFLELEAHGSQYAEYSLDAGYAFLADEKNSAVLDSDKSHIARAETHSARLLIQKVFPDAQEKQFFGTMNERMAQLKVENGELSDTPATKFGRWLYDSSTPAGEIVSEKAEAEAINRDEALQRLLVEAEEDRVLDLLTPTLHRFLLRRYLAQLDKITFGVERFKLLAVDWEHLPAHLQILMSNAHEAELLGQDVACAVLCGTALEEALKFSLGRDSFDGLAKGIARSVQVGLITKMSPEETAARDVNMMRNKAAHDPGDYLADPSRKKREILDNTRFVIAHLFTKAGV